MADEKDANAGAWTRVPTWDGSPQTWRSFRKEMSWWLAGLDIQSAKKYNLAARWLLKQSGVVRQRGEEFDPRDLEYGKEIKMPNAETGDDEVVMEEDPLSGINKLLTALEEMTGRSSLDKGGELRNVFYLELKHKLFKDLHAADPLYRRSGDADQKTPLLSRFLNQQSGASRASSYAPSMTSSAARSMRSGSSTASSGRMTPSTSFRRPFQKQAMVSEVEEEIPATAEAYEVDGDDEEAEQPSLEEEIEESVEAAAEAFLTMKVSLKKQSDKRPCFDCGLPGHWAGILSDLKPGQQLGRKKKVAPKQVKVAEATMHCTSCRTDGQGDSELYYRRCWAASPQAPDRQQDGEPAKSKWPTGCKKHLDLAYTMDRFVYKNLNECSHWRDRMGAQAADENQLEGEEKTYLQ
ncbi:unnamed protein product [Durusdinium trenchii]|uniref:Uncharacterized protein n=1 Tax=Durusdinium trenchii TaxID=1381693 RepID=A0ABP0KDI5_9DINO